MVTVVKQIFRGRARAECKLLVSSARSLSHNVPQQYTRLHIYLTEEQPKKGMSYKLNDHLWTKWQIYFTYYILNLLHNLTFAEAYWWWLHWS